MALNVSDLLLRVTGDVDDARRELAELARDLSKLDGDKAEAEASVDAADAIAKLELFRERLQAIDRERVSPEVNVQVADAIAKIAVLEQRLKRIDGSKTIDIKLRRSLISQLGSIERTTGSIVRGAAEAERAGSAVIGGFAKVATAVVTGVINTIGDVVRKVPAIGGALARPFFLLAEGGVKTIAVLGPLALVILPLLLIAAQQLVGSLIAVGASLFALGASAAAAVAGLAALSVAMAAAFGPVLIVGIALFARLVKVIQALSEESQKRAAAEQAVKTAQEQVRTATEALTTASESLEDQTVAGFRAMEDAAESYSDRLREIDGAKLGVKEARLELRDASAALRDFRRQHGLAGRGFDSLFQKSKDIAFDPARMRELIPKVGGKKLSGDDERALEHLLIRRQRALLGIRDANDRVGDSERELARDQAENLQFQREGVKAYRPYRQALDARTKAQKQLVKANKELESSQKKLTEPLAGLTSGERKFAGVLRSIGAELKNAFGPAVNAALAGVTDFLKDLIEVLTDKNVASGLKAVGTAIGEFFRAFGRRLNTQQWKSAFADFANSAARLMGSGTRAIIAFFDILRQIAQAALPALESGSKKVADKLEDLAGKPRKIRGAVTGAIDHFKVWLGVAKELARVVGSFMRAAAGDGKSLADSLRRMLKRWADFLNTKEGQKRIRGFFDHSKKRVGEIKDGFAEWIPKVKKIVDLLADAADFIRKISDFFGGASLNGEVKASLEPSKQIASGVKKLHTHLSPNEREDTRNSVLDAIKDLQKQGVKLSPGLRDLLRRLQKATGHAAGGVVAGTGTGDTQPIWATPGEFVVRKAIVRSIGLPAMRAFNTGHVAPALAAAGAGFSRGGDHIEIHVPQAPAAHGQPDPVVTAQDLARLMRRRGGR